MGKKAFYVYILTNKSNNVLYTGITNNLLVRVCQHKNKVNMNSFTSRYNVNKLIYFEIFKTPFEAITREKQIKAGSRKRKLDLIQSINPEFADFLDKLHDLL